MKTELEDLAAAVAALFDAELALLSYDQALAQAARATWRGRRRPPRGAQS